MRQSPPITRREFVQHFMRECGLSYAQAGTVYEAMCRVFEDGIVSGSKISIGRVGCLAPVWLPSREIHMHFKVGKGRKIDRNVHRTYNMDGRFTFKFRLYQQFMARHQLKWFQEMPGL
jgi:hypothetical protein